MNPLVAIVLATIILIAGTLGYFELSGSASTNVEAQNISQNLQAIFSNVTQQFSNNPLNFTGFNNTDAIDAHIPPGAWVPTGQTTAINDPWGGTVTFSTASINGGTDNGWQMELTQVPQSQCSSAASVYTAQVSTIEVNGATVATNPSYNGGTASTATPWPPSAAVIQAACSQTSNTLTWDTSGQ